MATLLDKRRKAPEPDETTVDHVLSRIAAMAPLVARHAQAIEQDRRLPADIVSSLKSARIYSMLVPRRYGGLELHAPSAFRAICALARLDGSVGWNAMIGQIGALMSHGAVAVGIAEGAIMDLVELAGAGVKQLFMTTPLVETERFKEGLARLDADLMAARALLEAQVAHVWQNPERPAAKDMARVAEQLQAAIWITAACVRVAEGCFELAGSRAVYESSSLQRRVRDLRVAAQHVAVHPRHYVTAGAAVLARLSGEHVA